MLDTVRESAPDPLDLVSFFAGRTRAWGIVQDRFGTVRRRFTAIVDGSWDDDRFVMDEAFHFDDGSKERRIWTLRHSPDGKVVATTDDLVGAASIRADGVEVRLSYDIRLQMGGRTLVTRFDDRMWRVDDDTVLNRARMTKWGVRLADISICFRRQQTGLERQYGV